MLHSLLLVVLSQLGTRGDETVRDVGIGPEIIDLRAYLLSRRIPINGFIDDKTKNQIAHFVEEFPRLIVIGR